MERSVVNFTYKKHHSLETEECYYCGHYGDEIDHCPPISKLPFYINYDRWLVKCCRSCNRTLGGKFLPTLLSRVEYLLKRYRIKYRKYLSMPDWSDEELSELKGSLKIYIEDERHKNETVHNRLEFLMDRKTELINSN